jgi:hypothetical protein
VGVGAAEGDLLAGDHDDADHDQLRPGLGAGPHRALAQPRCGGA